VSQISVLACSFEALTHILKGSGRAKYVWSHLRKGQSPWENSLGQKQQKLFSDSFAPFGEQITSINLAECGTTKVTIQLFDKLEIETVLIPMNGRTTLCVSSQVGCARDCQFCATGQMGLVRNLTSHEILFQVYTALNYINQRTTHLPPLRNIVFMGMGEPLNNWKHVKKTIEQLTSPRTFAFGPKRITLSTVGPSTRHIYKLRELPVRFAWSLHAAKDTTRKQLIPTTKATVGELTEAFSTVLKNKRDGLFIEVTLIDGINDSQEDARELVRCINRLPNETRVNLIPVNPSENAHFKPPQKDTIETFRAILHSAGYFCSIRPSRGQNKTSACGQLVTLRSSIN